MYDIRMVAILVANDNGSQPPTATPAAVAASVAMANEVFNPHGVNFLFDPATDIYRLNDDRLTRDCLRRDHQVYTDPGVEPGAAPEFEGEALGKYRNEVALRFPGRVVVYFGAGSRYHWSAAEQRWVYGPRTYSWSNGEDEYVTMAYWAAGGDAMAHEIGHYLHLGHVFWAQPASVADAVKAIKQFVEVQGGSKDGVIQGLFEGDGIADTPPDPGPNVFTNQCDPAETSVTIPVTFADGSSRSYTMTPDRENIMSYWDKRCRGGHGRLSAGQFDIVRNALHHGNRRHLVEPAVLYHGVFEPGDRSQTRAIGWAQTDFASRFNNELTAGRRCVHMQAYPVAGGQIRWDGVWEPAGGIQQTRAIGWALQDFAKRFDDELKAGRHCVHMQGYDMGGGQVRYDGIWESGGNNGQTRAIGWAFNHLIGRWDAETAQGRRLVHLQAYDVGGGQLRYDAIWEPSAVEQTRVLALPLWTFADHFDELTSSGHSATMMTACLRTYPTLPPAAGPAARALTFGSDFDRAPAALAALPVPPLHERGPGCDLTTN